MFNPNSPNYVLNDDGVPEYDSVIVTIDDVTGCTPEDRVVHKLVPSSQSPVAALATLFGYEGCPELGNSPSVLSALMEAGKAQHPVFILPTPRNIQIVMGTGTLYMLETRHDFGNGSSMLAMVKLQDVVMRSLGGFADQGALPALMVLDFSLEAAPQQERAAQEEPIAVVRKRPGPKPRHSRAE